MSLAPVRAGASAAPRRRPAAAAEDFPLTVALGAMALLPIAEIGLRALFHTGIPGTAVIVQHLTLLVGALGGAVAAREDRLLALSAAPLLMRGRLLKIARLVSGCVAALVSLLMAVAGTNLVLAEHAAASQLLPHVPLWAVQSVLPLAFAVIAVRLIYHAGSDWYTRLACALICATVMAAAGSLSLDAHALRIPALTALAIATILGAPVFTTLAGAALILFWSDGLPIASLAVDHYRMTVNPSLPAIPLFTLAGYLLAESGAPGRLVRTFQALVGGLRGGAAAVAVGTCALFTALTGASGVTILALGALLMPLLLAARVSQRDALGLVTSAGSLGVLLPPSLPLILYAVVGQLPMEELFLAALLPAAALMGVVGVFAACREPRRAQRRFDADEARRALWAAKWELALPVVAFGALFSGYATPVEAAAVTALYAFVVTVLVHRELSLVRDVPHVVAECGLLVGGVLLILGVALGFTNYLVDAQVPDHAVDWVKGSISSRCAFLLALNAFLLAVGCLMDVFSAIVVVVPLIVPIGLAFGIDPLHLGVIFLANMELGFLTPPVGMNLFFASYRFGKPMPEVCRAVLPYAVVLAAGVLLVTYIPSLTTWLPGLGEG
ncbi:MAG TPA: TRAP transporter large permease subunit [Burkholderiales bacterium]|nr:TRAP transporter large permease subunit [Burkholderiales bacterium]